MKKYAPRAIEKGQFLVLHGDKDGIVSQSFGREVLCLRLGDPGRSSVYFHFDIVEVSSVLTLRGNLPGMRFDQHGFGRLQRDPQHAGLLAVVIFLLLPLKLAGILGLSLLPFMSFVSVNETPRKRRIAASWTPRGTDTTICHWMPMAFSGGG